MSFIKITEQPSLHEDLEQLSVRSLLEGINEEDQKVALAVRSCICLLYTSPSPRDTR